MKWPGRVFIASVLLCSGCRWRFDELVDARGSGSSGDAGDASLLCGDGVVESGEECDDGGATAACSSVCTLIDQGPGGTCAVPKVLVLARTASGFGARATGDTSTAVNGAQASCTAANTKDHTYAIAIAAATTLDVTLTPTASWDPALAIRDGSLACNQSTTLCCESVAAVGQPETSSCAVVAGTMMVIVDAATGNQAGPYALTLSIP